MDIEKYIQETEQWKKEIEAELAEYKTELQRQDDYRQIMNAMAAHSFGYNSQNQKNELDKYWVKSREDIYYNGHTTQKGVYEYYVDGTKEIRDSQREIINRLRLARICQNRNGGRTQIAHVRRGKHSAVAQKLLNGLAIGFHTVADEAQLLVPGLFKCLFDEGRKLFSHVGILLSLNGDFIVAQLHGKCKVTSDR